MTGVALIQEYLTCVGQVRNLTSSEGTAVSVAPNSNAKSYIFIGNHINALPLLELCFKDTTAVRMTYLCGSSYEELILTTAYL
jgi:hypothetical protein